MGGVFRFVGDWRRQSHYPTNPHTCEKQRVSSQNLSTPRHGPRALPLAFVMVCLLGCSSEEQALAPPLPPTGAEPVADHGHIAQELIAQSRRRRELLLSQSLEVWANHDEDFLEFPDEQCPEFQSACAEAKVLLEGEEASIRSIFRWVRAHQELSRSAAQIQSGYFTMERYRQWQAQAEVLGDRPEGCPDTICLSELAPELNAALQALPEAQDRVALTLPGVRALVLHFADLSDTGEPALLEDVLGRASTEYGCHFRSPRQWRSVTLGIGNEQVTGYCRRNEAFCEDIYRSSIVGKTHNEVYVKYPGGRCGQRRVEIVDVGQRDP